MAIYTFSTVLLSAQKTGSPPLLDTSLSATGVSFLSGSNVVFATQQVGVVSLSTTDAGIAFNPVNITVGATSLSTFNLSTYPVKTVNILGSVVNIPSALNGSDLGIIETTAGDYTVFNWLSATTTVDLSAMVAQRGVSTPDTRRKRLLGY